MRKKIGIILISMLLIFNAFLIISEASKISVIQNNKKIDEDYKEIKSSIFSDPIDIIDQQQTKSEKNIWGLDFYAQSFIPTLETLTKIELRIYKRGSPDGIEVFIREENGGDLANKYIDAEELSPGAQWFTFDFPDIVVLDPGSIYYIVVKPDHNDFGPHYISWYFAVGNYYDNGAAFYYQEENWIQQNSDFCFKTYGLDESPNNPIITGLTNGKKNIEYEYKFVSDDPEGHNITYMIDWGDATNSGWTAFCNSGTKISLNHTWDNKGNYTIRAKAKDIYGAESDWSPHNVNITGNKSYIDKIKLFLQRFLQRFPLFEKILNQII